MIIIDMISDLHGYYPKLDGGDLLIVSGDLTASDKMIDWIDFFYWLNKQSYRKKVYIGGNHDNFLTLCATNVECKDIYLDEEDEECEKKDYLCDSGTEFEGLKIWGSPWTKAFPGMNPKCMAFTCDTDEELAEKWALIPDNTDILITHSPPFGILDEVNRYTKSKRSNEYVGSKSLRNTVLDRNRLPNLKLHVFGHIHEQGGKVFETNFTKFANASIVNEVYEHVNKPIRVIL